MKIKTKKFLSVVMSLFLIVSALPTMASASDGIEIMVSSAECLPGETVVVTVDLINNPGIASLKLKVVYDDVLTLQSVVYNSEIGGQSIQPQTMTSPATLMWVSPFSDYKSDTTFATLTFTVAQDATPNSVANISLTYDPNDIYDMTETNIPCSITNGKVVIGSIDGEDEEYITPAENSKIDYSNKIIFSGVWCETDINNIVNISDDGNVEVTPNSSNFIGTGSTLVINKSNSTVNYNIVIVGDVNGDSACDVLDAASIYLFSSGLKTPTENEIFAANGSIEENIDENDYQNIINWILAENVTLDTEHTVTFADYDGAVLKTESVSSGDWATPPENPTRDGYEFIGWDKPIDNISEDTIITAEYALLDGPAFVVEHVNAQAGAEDIAVTISLTNNPGISSIGMYVDFDSSLTLTNIIYNSSIGGQAVPPQTFASPAKLTWVSPFADVDANDVFVTLYFSVDELAFGKLPISIRYNENDVYDMTETNVNFDVVNNSILIIK